MLPELRFVVGGTQVVVALHALAVVVGVAAGATVAARRAAEPALALAAVATVAVAALGGARVLFVLLHGGGVQSGGLASTGGIAAGVVATWMFAAVTRRSPATLLDAIVPAGLLALGIGRLGCFLGGCCYGQATALPWGIVFPEVGLPARHPLQLYSAAADVALFLALRPRGAALGMIACRGCVGFGLVRAALELLRDPGTTDVLAAGLTLPQAAALLLAAAAAICARRLRLQSPSTMPRPSEDTSAWPRRNR